MSHAGHFLSRLARLERHDDVETALKLYRHPRILASVLESLGPGSADDRFALALSRQYGGPHLVVTRGGAFLTCLGPGMEVTLPVVHRLRLDELVAKAEHRRVESVGHVRTFLDELSGPDELPKEAFLDVSALRPAMEPSLVRQVAEGYPRLRLSMGRCSGRGTVTDALRRQLCADAQRPGHCAVLFALGGEAAFKRQPGLHALLDLFSQPWLLIGYVPTLLRMIWAAGRAGDWRVESLARQRFSGADAVQARLLDLGLLALRRERLFEPARALIATAPDSSASEEDRSAHAALAPLVLDVLDAPGRALRRHRHVGAEHVLRLAERAPAPSRYRFQKVADVPTELAYPAVLLQRRHLASETDFRVIVDCLPFLARCKAEDLYLPDEALSALGVRSYHPDFSRWLVEQDVLRFGKPQPVRAGQRTGRNEPCPCGSGKKYKQCHGAKG